MLATATHVLGAIAWDPEIRNILALVVGIGVLCGSVYLLLGTNTGPRTGLLIALAGLFGWLMTMGIIWWIYGIGMKGAEASWKPRELNYSSADYGDLRQANIADARKLTGLGELPSAQDILAEHPDYIDEILPPDTPADQRDARAANISMGQILEVHPELADQLHVTDTLGGWRLLPVSDRQRGDASATADEFLGADQRGVFESTSNYIVLDVFSIGGKDPLPDDPTRWDRIWTKLHSVFVQPLHPTHYAAVQVRAVIPECAEDQRSTDEAPCYTVTPGEAAPVPVVDEDAPVITVVLERDLGDKRFPAFMTTVIFGTLFVLTCWVLHRRDAVVAARRAAPA